MNIMHATLYGIRRRKVTESGRSAFPGSLDRPKGAEIVARTAKTSCFRGFEAKTLRRAWTGFAHLRLFMRTRS